MHCRAYLLLEREYKQFQKNPEWGIEVVPSENNAFCWHATVSGLADTAWEDGCFHLTVEFSENYDHEPPVIRFNTIPFHPNIDPDSGDLCLDLPEQDGTSKETVSIRSILVNIQALLSNPILDQPVNMEAANLLKTSPHIYMQLVKNCVTESKNISEVIKKQHLEPVPSNLMEQNKKLIISSLKPLPSSTSSITRRPKQVSFDDYHRYWVSIASSQPSARIPLVRPFSMDEEISYLKTVEGPFDLSSPHRLSPYPRDGSTTPSASKVIAMDTEQKMNKLRQKKLERISAMKQLYLNKTDDTGPPGNTAPVSSLTDVADSGKPDDIWEEEANDLVAWSTSLHEDSV